MSGALLPAHVSHCSPLNKLSLCRVGRQQRLTPLTKRQPQRARGSVISNVATAPLPPPADISTPARPQQTTPDLSQKPPFTLSDLKRAIPAHCWQKNTAKSVSYLVKDVAIVAGLAVAAYSANTWWAWPAYWLAQGTMFWALFVVGHDCGHQSFSSNKKINDFVGNVTHSSILVPYHGWRISHRTHHSNHGHVENDESWHPVAKKLYDSMDPLARIGRLTFPISMLAFPFYLMSRSPGKQGSHYDPKADLFIESEEPLIKTSNRFLIGMWTVLAGFTAALGPLAMFNLYFMPYWINVMWLDAVTYLHHHGSENEEKIPWYRGEEWSYLRGGLSTIDRDYGIFNKIHHDIGTHVLHHLFPQMPHYNLEEATEAIKPVMKEYYRVPEKSKGPIPFHLWGHISRSFQEDHFVADTGDIVYYEKDPDFAANFKASQKRQQHA